jgi:DNA-binding NarL/FixJ family response regulator
VFAFFIAEGEIQMNIGKSYIELCDEIEMWTFRKETIEDQVSYLMDKNKPKDIGAIDYSEPTGGSDVVLDFEELVNNIDPMQNEIQRLELLIQRLSKSKMLIENKLEEAEGIDYQIIYKKYVEGKSLKIIAEELNYSYAWIRAKVSKY